MDPLVVQFSRHRGDKLFERLTILEDTDPLRTVAKATGGDVDDDEGMAFEDSAQNRIYSCSCFGWRNVVFFAVLLNRRWGILGSIRRYIRLISGS